MKKYLLILLFGCAVLSFNTYNAVEIGNIVLKDKSSKIILSPNPARSFVRINCTDNSVKIKQVSIMSILGPDVINVTLSTPNNLIEINIAKLNQGKYFVKVVYTDGSSDIEQLIKV